MKSYKVIVALASVFALAALAGCAGGANQAASSAASEAASSAVEAASSAVEAVSSEVESASSEAASSEAATASSETPAVSVATANAVADYWINFPESGNNQLPAADIFKMIDAGDDIILLDIRSADDYAEGHLKGAVNIPYGELGANLEAIPDDKDIWINCYTGQTSSQATALLNFAGKKAHNIQSGWLRGITKAEGYENYIETEANELPAGTYTVDPDIKADIENYFASEDKPFNFDPAELKAAIDDGTADQYAIVSVRSAADYAGEGDASKAAQGHIPGAINIPFGKDMQTSFADIPEGKQVIVYCYTGQTASQVVASLRMLGFDAWNLNGGMGKAPEGENEGFGWLSVEGAADLLETAAAKAA